MSPPSPNAGNGRDGRGRFAKGNCGGPGNPHARHVGQLRSALLAAVTREDIEAVVRKLIELAKSGNIQAATEILDRCLGRAVQPIGTAGEVETTPVRICLVLDEGPAGVSSDDFDGD